MSEAIHNISALKPALQPEGPGNPLAKIAERPAPSSKMSSTHEDVSNIEIGSAGSRLQETLLSIRSLRAAIADSGIQPASSERVSGEDYIRDEGAANDVIDLAKFQILNQSGASPLGQASQSAQSILQLLK